MNKSLFFLFHFLIVSAFCFSQATNYDSIPKDFERGIKDIVQLRKGVLIVRLNFRERAINNFKEAGKSKKAFVMKLQQDTLNVELMRSIKRKFTFCPVYFMRTDFYRDFMEGNRRVFLNDRLEMDTSILFPEDMNYYFLELGDVFNTVPLDEHHYKNYGKSITGSTIVATNSLVIKDSSLTQLPPPFPYYLKLSELKDLTVDCSWLLVPDSIQTGKKKTYHEVLIIEKNRVRGTFDIPVSRLNYQLGQYFISRSKQLYAWGSNFAWLRNIFKTKTQKEMEDAIREEEKNLKE